MSGFLEINDMMTCGAMAIGPFESSMFLMFQSLMSCTNASFLPLQLAAFEGCLARNEFLRDSKCAKSCTLQTCSRFFVVFGALCLFRTF